MPDLLIHIALFLGALYIGMLVAFAIGLRQTCQNAGEEQPQVSVIVPAHNESHNIDACLDGLATQTYAQDRLELIVVDDRSTDDTVQRIQNRVQDTDNLHLIRVETRRYACPKKNALWHGLSAATGEIILTTDADCRPSPKWVEAMVRAFAPKIGMVIGHAPLKSTGDLRGELLSLQGLVVAALAAGSAGVGLPLTCSGRNLAYRKKAFDDVGGFDGIGHIIGGDDVLLMRRVARTSWRICFLSNPDAQVPSQVHTDRLLDRQIRYQSKAMHYALPILLLALAVYTFHLILFLYPVIAWIYPSLIPAIGSALLAKIAADVGFLYLASRRLSTPIRFWGLALLEPIAIPYIAIICALGIRKSLKWK